MHFLSRKIIKEKVQAGTKLGWDQFLFRICSILTKIRSIFFMICSILTKIRSIFFRICSILTKICSIFFMICSILNNILSFLSSSRRSQISANTTEHIAALISSALSLSTTFINLRTIHCRNKRINTPMWCVQKIEIFIFLMQCSSLAA